MSEQAETISATLKVDELRGRDEDDLLHIIEANLPRDTDAWHAGSSLKIARAIIAAGYRA